MLSNIPLLWESILFSGLALLIVGVSLWWLFLSPMKTLLGNPGPASARLAGWLAGLLGLSGLQTVTGALWDASMHIQTGEVPGGTDFLWPPHLVIYSGFLTALLAAVASIGVVALGGLRAGHRDPRWWVRRNPYLGAVALASAYSLLSIPGDALWHELVGLDLTAWSPPHVALAATMGTVIVCGVGLLVQARGTLTRPAVSSAAILILLSLMLNVVYIIGVLEWELPGQMTRWVMLRPIWFYPLVGGGLAFYTLVLAKRLVPFRWSATATAALFYFSRLAITAGLGATGGFPPAFPLWFLLGAALLDLLPLERLPSLPLRDLSASAAYTAGYLALALPALSLRADLQSFRGWDVFFAAAATLLLSLLLFPLAQWTGRQMLGEGARRLLAATPHPRPFSQGEKGV